MLRLHTIVTSILAALIPAAIAVAQATPPEPNLSGASRSPVWVGYVAAFFFVAVLVIATILPSKRSQDDL
ncbi:MAG: hypothetical protein MK085_00560 [Phycisphaerales bacterium]|nr:hypothetical protein [Phycisphaerales bacterium]